MKTSAETIALQQVGSTLWDDLTDEDLEFLWEAVKDGAHSYGAALGFDETVLNSIESIALSHYRSARYHQASLIYSFILQMSPKRSAAWRGLAACSHAQKEYHIAAGCYHSALTWNPTDIVSKLYCGECMCMLGELEVGLRLFQEVIDSETDDEAILPYVTRARSMLAAKGGYPARVILTKEGRQLVAQTQRELEQMGVEFDSDREIQLDDMMRNPELREGLEDVKKALREGRLTWADVGEFTENELDGAFAAACSYVNMGKGLEAMQISGYLMLLDPYKSRYYQVAGICLQRMKQYELADHYYRIALSLNREDPMTLVYRGEAKIMLGHIDEGIGLIRKGMLLVEGKSNYEALTERSQILIKQFAS